MSKLDNWQTSVNIDYLSMFIKTWFAFLTSLKDIYPNITSKTGDGKIIEHYIENLQLPNNYDQDIREQIKKMYTIGEIVMKRDLPDIYFGRFYKLNSNFRHSIDIKDKYEVAESRLWFRISYKEKVNKRSTPNLFIEFKGKNPLFNKNLKVHVLSFNIPVNKIINNGLYANKEQTLSSLLDSMINHANDHIDNIPYLTSKGKEDRKEYIRKIITEIGQVWRPEFKIDDLFQPLPILGFPQDYDQGAHKLVVIKWFIRFNYNLRNILFHHIVDPFDEEWLKLFKHAYLALKEVVVHNSSLIVASAEQILPLSTMTSNQSDI